MHSFPDMPTLYAVCDVFDLVVCMGLLLVWANSRTYPGFKQWVIGSFCALASNLLLAVWAYLPAATPVTLIVNLLSFLYPLLIARGLRLFADLPAKDWIAHATLGAVTVIVVTFYYVYPDPNIRVFLLSLLLVPLFADCALLVRRLPTSSSPPSVKNTVIILFALLSLWNLLRVPLTVALQGWEPNRAPPVILGTTLTLLIVCKLGSSFAFIVLNYARASDSLRESEKRFQAAMQQAPIGMSLIGIDGRWLEVNPALCAIVGYSKEELLTLDFQTITHPEDRAADEPLFRQLIAQEIPTYNREKRYVRKDGQIVWANVHVSAIIRPDGSIRHLVSQVVDVTKRKQAEQSLNQSQARLMQAMDATKLGHWEFDLATQRFTLDENCFKLLGTSAATEGSFEMSADDYDRRFLPPDEVPRLKEVTEQAIAQAEPGQTTEIDHPYYRADGSAGIMSVRFAIERDASGRAIRAYGLSQDITEQSRAAQKHRMLEEQLRHAQKMDALGTLAGGIAHDFNNILTGIMGNLDLAAMDLPANHPVQPRLHDARQASRRARDHVARILTFSRRYQGDRKAKLLGPVVQEAVQLLRASLPVTIEIRTKIAPDYPAILCDAAQIHQVIMNLGTNAAHAMRGRNGLLAITIDPVIPDATLMERHPQVKSTHRVRLSVRDTGSGIDPRVMARIFEPFFTTKPPDEGTGLGLAMVHGIVEDHQGAIIVTSTLGQGTTVTIYFPPAADQGASTGARADEPPVALPPFGQGRKVMIVDDDTTVLRLGNQILQLAGFSPEAFSNPTSALKKFESSPREYSAVISDLTMPGLTGVDLARRVRELRPDLPFILTSGYLHSEAQGGALESGVAHFIKKPFDVTEFTAKLRAALGEEKAKA